MDLVLAMLAGAVWGVVVSDRIDALAHVLRRPFSATLATGGGTPLAGGPPFVRRPCSKGEAVAV